ncbi:MAG: RNA polymerase sigma factor [Eubacteriales bacterium]|nr:RNA polymerase sigma factor [Eubacteriales bacterium]
MAVSNEDIRLAQNGDANAFSRLYKETIKTAYFVAKNILVKEGEEAIEDVLQDSYVAVFRNINTFSTGNFQGWVDVIVSNRAKNYRRKKKPMLFSEMESEDEDAPELQFEDENIEFRPDEQMDYSETKRLVMEIINGLSEEQRIAVILYYFDEMSVKDIATACECSENTIKSRLNYARKNIKEKVEDLEKRGTKLYCFPLIPFLFWLFKEEFKATTVSAAVLNQAGAAIMAKSGVASVQKSVQNTIVKNIAVAAVEQTAKKGGLSLVAKILIGVAGAAVISGAAVGGYALFNDNDKIEENDKKAIEVEYYVFNENDSKDDNNSVEIDKTSETTYQIKNVSKNVGTNITYNYIQIEGWDNPNIDEWNKVLAPESDVSGLSSAECNVEILVQNENLLSIKISGSEYYTGAMHPNNYVNIYNINMQTGEKYQLSDIVDIDAYCEKVGNGDYTTDYKGGVNDSVIDEIYQCSSYAIAGKTTTADKFKALIDSNSNLYMHFKDDFWAVHDGQVDMYFSVTHAAGDNSCISVKDVIKK